MNSRSRRSGTHGEGRSGPVRRGGFIHNSPTLTKTSSCSAVPRYSEADGGRSVSHEARLPIPPTPPGLLGHARQSPASLPRPKGSGCLLPPGSANRSAFHRSWKDSAIGRRPFIRAHGRKRQHRWGHLGKTCRRCLPPNSTLQNRGRFGDYTNATGGRHKPPLSACVFSRTIGLLLRLPLHATHSPLLRQWLFPGTNASFSGRGAGIPSNVGTVSRFAHI